MSNTILSNTIFLFFFVDILSFVLKLFSCMAYFPNTSSSLIVCFNRVIGC